MSSSLSLLALALVAVTGPPSGEAAPDSDPPAAGPAQGILETCSNRIVPCATWKIGNTCFLSLVDLTPYLGMEVVTWLNWAVVPCPRDVMLVPYASGVDPVHVSRATWGRVKALYAD